MTIPTSTAPAAKAWLFGQLQDVLTAAGDGATFGVTYGVPGQQAADDAVWVADTTDRILTPFALVGTMGPHAFRENYTLTVNIDCYRGGDQAQTVEERAWVLNAAAETIVRTDPTLGGNVLRSQPQDTSSTTTWDGEYKGRTCSIPLTIACLAEL